MIEKLLPVIEKFLTNTGNNEKNKRWVDYIKVCLKKGLGSVTLKVNYMK
jgi:hypothetical protein